MECFGLSVAWSCQAASTLQMAMAGKYLVQQQHAASPWAAHRYCLHLLSAWLSELLEPFWSPCKVISIGTKQELPGPECCWGYQSEFLWESAHGSIPTLVPEVMHCSAWSVCSVFPNSLVRRAGVYPPCVLCLCLPVLLVRSSPELTSKWTWSIGILSSFPLDSDVSRGGGSGILGLGDVAVP